MAIRKYTSALCLLLLAGSICKAQTATRDKVSSNIVAMATQDFKDAAAQYKLLRNNLTPGMFPKTWSPVTGKYEFSKSGWWCSGFYPGTLLYLYHQTKDTALLHEAIRMLALLKNEQFNKTTHDLGFMMHCSYGTANRLQPIPEYNDVLINSAKSLATRFNPTVGCIKSWDSKTKDDYLVIIDNMMNLELLFYATSGTHDSSYYKIAVAHANTTMKNHFRPDYSSYHVINYNAEDGTVKQKRTAQGAADSSAWARGQAWGLYGYTVMYRVTKQKEYLDQANHIASFILNHPNLPADKIPYWDFNAPGIPNALRDASAASIIASALIELSTYTGRKPATRYMDVAKTILQSLSGPDYKAAAGTNGGFILKHGVGHMPNKTEVDVPLTYGDYYFIEALTRMKNLKEGRDVLFLTSSYPYARGSDTK